MQTQTRFDENLHDQAVDPASLRQYIAEVERLLETESTPALRVSRLGELAVHNRVLGDLAKAETLAIEALQLTQEHQLGLHIEAQQKIRLGNIKQWQKDFTQSDLIFSEVVELCRQNSAAKIYLDFALQHSGKNQFDQNKFNEALALFEEALTLREARNAPADQLDSTRYAIRRTQELLLQALAMPESKSE